MNIIHKLKVHHRLARSSRSKLIRDAKSHNPMLVLVGVKGKPNSPKSRKRLDAALDEAMKELIKKVHRFAAGEIKEGTVKVAEAEYLKLLRRSKHNYGRLKSVQQSLEFWEGFILAMQIAMDYLELAFARVRRKT